MEPGAAPEPASACRPAALWRWEEVRDPVRESGTVISAAEAERRVLVLENPGLRVTFRITTSLYAGLQLVLPGEVAPAHRHSQSVLAPNRLDGIIPAASSDLSTACTSSPCSGTASAGRASKTSAPSEGMTALRELIVRTGGAQMPATRKGGEPGRRGTSTMAGSPGELHLATGFAPKRPKRCQRYKG